ncbi:hypothetical protein PInf_012890 [Phytophthora infestans]|nr:hypothetical protein PInf_012890 [Phytophthora infestans]
MSDADPDDDYASDEYEPESPACPQSPQTQSQHLPSSSPVTAQSQPTLQLDTNLPDDESESGAVTPVPKEGSKRARTSRESNSVSGRRLMDNTAWTYTVSALQVRMLRIPVVDSATIRELRVFATIDKQAAQSRGSRWKQEFQSVGRSPQRSTRKRGQRNKSLRRVEPYRRSGLIEEAKWTRGEGKLQWTFPMEKFRHLKAYAPRVKAFVYGIGEAGVVNPCRAQIENLARQEKEGAILSFGWFFLDLRTIACTIGKQIRDTIGDGTGQDIFVLSVFIQAASNLLKVVETSVGENRQALEETGFWLSYSLFDVVVQTGIFHNLSVAEFSPIRDSFRVKTSLKDLALCLEALGTLSVFLCSENRVLAGVEIPLHLLLSKGFFAEGRNKPKPGDTVDVDGKFSFPDFKEAIISASVAVELVESKDTKTQGDLTSDWFTVKDKGELESMNFYCMFDLAKNPLQLKQEMQESVRIDLVCYDEET